MLEHEIALGGAAECERPIAKGEKAVILGMVRFMAKPTNGLIRFGHAHPPADCSAGAPLKCTPSRASRAKNDQVDELGSSRSNFTTKEGDCAWPGWLISEGVPPGPISSHGIGSGRVTLLAVSAPRPFQLTGPDFVLLAETLAQAFRDNPLNRAVIGPNEAHRLRANRAGMRASLVSAASTCTILVSPDAEAPPGPVSGLAAGLIAMPPGAWPLPPPPFSDQFRLLIGQGWRTARRWGEVFEALKASHPPEPHWYLSLVGVRPDLQGRGYGSDLVARWLDGVDRDEHPAYVETDRLELASFYGRFGFELLGSEKIFGVPILRFWRPRQ